MTKEYIYQPLVCNYNWVRDVNIIMPKNEVLLIYSHIQNDIVIRTVMDVKTSKFKSKFISAINTALDYYHSLIELSCKDSEEEVKYNRNINILYFILDDLQQQ